MKRAELVFGIHCHQPVGNFPEVIEQAYQDAYLPFIAALLRYPKVKAVLHYTGPLWEFFADRHPEFIEMVEELVDRDQVELLGGGFYEPILTVIPKEDAVGQLYLMRDYLRQLGCDPKGIWLAERVWEPIIPSLLAPCDVHYLPVDDTHFHRAGLTDDQLIGYYLTEDQGKAIGVFPISTKLRYLIPFHPLAEVISYAREMAAKHENPLLVLVDDGEKFGVWPGTKTWVYDQGWLEGFFQAVSELDWLSTVTLAEAFSSRRPLGQVYLPTTSYFELGEWALPCEAARKLSELRQVLGERLPEFEHLLSGGYWRGFLAKYPEANYMHKRMLWTSHKLADLPEEDSEAKRYLFRAQSNDAYWHGLFGGIYLPHLRDAVWRNLLAADALLGKHRHRSATWLDISQLDLDADGGDEIVLETERWLLTLAPHRGGSLLELSDKFFPFNFLAAVARRPEAYHAEVGKACSGEASARGIVTKQIIPQAEGVKTIHELVRAKMNGLERYLIYDRSPRSSLLDRIFLKEATLANVLAGKNVERVSPATLTYAHEIQKKGREASVTLSWEGAEWRLWKEIGLGPGREMMPVYLLVENVSQKRIQAKYGIEFNLALLAGDAPDRYFQLADRELPDKKFASTGEEMDVGVVRAVNRWEGWAMEIQASPKATLWRYPVQTVQNSEAGFELVYQASCLIFLWDLDLGPGESFTAWLSIGVARLGDE